MSSPDVDDSGRAAVTPAHGPLRPAITPPRIAAVALALMLLAGACAGSRPTTTGRNAFGPTSNAESAPDPPRSRRPEPVCGLVLPCTPTGVQGAHDLYGAMASGAEARSSPLFAQDSPGRGCLACTDPAEVFGEIEERQESAPILHLYFALRAAADEAFRERQPASIDSGLDELHEWTHSALDGARTSGAEVSCALASAHCASDRDFMARFVEFADRTLRRVPLDEDPGNVKEVTVKLALAMGPPGAIPVVCRFIRSGAHVSARMKAVRDICGYAPYYEEVRETLRWVVAEDPWLRDRAEGCVAGFATDGDTP